MSSDSFIGVVLEGKYRLDRKIGEGGMGAVYLGVQLMVDRPVAIKLLHAGLTQHERVKKRFEVEARAIGRLSHPNVITLYDFGFSQEIDAFYMVMEFLDGPPMHKRTAQGVSGDEAITITKQIAAALDHAHHLKILHRDLKPENIIIVPMTDGSELVKVLDFGIARIFKDDDDVTKSQADRNRITRAGEVFGTPAYISPEQARGERDLTPASDLYSLGVMLFEMLEGKLPFWGETAIDTIMLHITAPIPVITRIDVPDGLKKLTYALLAKEPSQRPQSGRALIAALDTIAASASEDTMSDWDPVPTIVDAPRLSLADEPTNPMSPAFDFPEASDAAGASGSATDELPAEAFAHPLHSPLHSSGPLDDARSNATIPDLDHAPHSDDRRTLALIALTCVAVFGALVLGIFALTGEESQAAEAAEEVRAVNEPSGIADPTTPAGGPPETKDTPEVEPEPVVDAKPEVDVAPEVDPEPEVEPTPDPVEAKATKKTRKKPAKVATKPAGDGKATTEKPKKAPEKKPEKSTIRKPVRLKLDDDEKRKPTRVDF
jgi:serine/threonine protein kinase